MFEIYYIGYALTLLIIILSLKLFKRNEKWLKSLIVFTIVHFILILIANTMADNGIHNFWVGQLISWWIFLMYAIIYYHYMNSLAYKKFIQISTFIQILGIILINIYIEPITTHPAFTYTIINTGIVINTLLAFLQIYQEEKEPYLERLPFFWINSAIFILYFSTTILFLIRNYVGLKLKNQALDDVVSYIIYNLYHLAYIIILIGIFILRKQMRSSTIQLSKK